jgi:hypothetical protein
MEFIYNVQLGNWLREHSAHFLPMLLRLPRRLRPKLIATYHQPPELFDSHIIKEVVPGLDCITVVGPEQVSYFRQFLH